MSPADAPAPEEEEGRVMPFLDHLEELRSTLFRSLIALVAGMLIAIPLAPKISTLTMLPLVVLGKDPRTFLQVVHVMGGVSIATRIIFWTGLIIAMPFIIYFVARFVFPGLRRQERSGVVQAGALAVVLFAMGVMLGYTLAMPEALKIMFWVDEVMGYEPAFFLVTDYVSFVLKLVLSFGLVFEMPVVILALGHLGLVNSAQLQEKRRIVIVAIFVVAMFLTPPDPYTLLIMAMPMCALYEACIWIIWLKERGPR